MRLLQHLSVEGAELGASGAVPTLLLRRRVLSQPRVRVRDRSIEVGYATSRVVFHAPQLRAATPRQAGGGGCTLLPRRSARACARTVRARECVSVERQKRAERTTRVGTRRQLSN